MRHFDERPIEGQAHRAGILFRHLVNCGFIVEDIKPEEREYITRRIYQAMVAAIRDDRESTHGLPQPCNN